MPGIAVVQERSQLSTPNSTNIEILNELKIQTWLLAQIAGIPPEALTDLRKDATLLNE